MNKELRKTVVSEIARNAFVGVPEISGVEDAELRKVASEVMEQDPWWASKRIHASVAALLALVLGAFGISWEEAELMELLAAAAATVAAVLPLLSKVSDKRMVRTRGGGAWPD